VASDRSLAIVDELDAFYRQSVAALRTAIIDYLENGVRPDPAVRAAGAFAYPELRLHYDGGLNPRALGRAYGRLNAPGDYAISVTQPGLFRDYLAGQLDMLIDDFGASVEIALGRQEIPYVYVLDGGDVDLGGAAALDLARIFPTTELDQIGAEMADGLWTAAPDLPRPLALFDAQRVDFSLARLRHYTGTPPAHVQNYVLFTNYHR
jgi:AMP nucleosidase